jgi:hypothetical protein
MPKITVHHCNAPGYIMRVAIPSEREVIKTKDSCLAARVFMVDGSRKKFVVIAFATGMSMGLLFTSLSFIKSQRDRGKDIVLYSTVGQAKLISSNVKCALSFDDAKDANGILESLKTQYNIAFAGIYDCNGKLFATYYRDDVNQVDFKPLPPSKARLTFHDNYMIISEPVIHQRQFLGTVCLWAQP